MKSRAFNKKPIAFDTKSGDYRRSIRSQHEIARKAITFDRKSIAFDSKSNCRKSIRSQHEARNLLTFDKKLTAFDTKSKGNCIKSARILKANARQSIAFVTKSLAFDPKSN